MPATTEDLLELHGRIRACTACPLHVSRTQAVPGYGPVDARIMAVGEGPGETEDREGKPFVGAAGKLLTQLLESVGLSRRDIYITNVVKCRPPGNRDPEPEEVSACSHFLDEQIAMLRPDVILVLGRHALQRLLPGRGSITRLHGERVRVGNRLYVPLYHPAAALYNGSLLETLRADMLRVRGYLEAAASAVDGDVQVVGRALTAVAAGTGDARGEESLPAIPEEPAGGHPTAAGPVPAASEHRGSDDDMQLALFE